MARIHLRHRESEGLQYGPNGEIKFGVRGGFAPGEFIGDDDDPLVQAVMAAEPVDVVHEPGEKAVVYVCSEHSDREFLSKNALASHVRSHKSKEGASDEA